MIQGDPLTGSLPATRAIGQLVLQPETRPRRAEWPIVADLEAVRDDELRPGRVAFIRTRRGTRMLRIRTVNRSFARGRNRRRRFIVGQTPRGGCRSVWVSRIISVRDWN